MNNTNLAVSKANKEFYDKENKKNFIDGSPHLKHKEIKNLLKITIDGICNYNKKFSSQLKVLDLGSGNGEITKFFLENDAFITAVDISEVQLNILKQNCSKYSNRIRLLVGDLNQDLNIIDEYYDIILFSSILHHIPNYLDLINRVIPKLKTNGQIFSFQDPLYYKSLNKFTKLFGKLSYYLWRITKKDLIGGFKRYIRRNKKNYNRNCKEDNIEYHVTRDGVNHLEISNLLTSKNFEVQILKYFSTQNSFFQKLGTFLKLKNTFAIVAKKNNLKN